MNTYIYIDIYMHTYIGIYIYTHLRTHTYIRGANDKFPDFFRMGI